MDGERRWRAARQLQWDQVPCIVRPEWEAAAIIVESLLGQRSLTKGAKVYLALPLLDEYKKSAETRRLSNLKKGIKTLEKPWNSPTPHSVRHREDGRTSEQAAERLGCSPRLVEQAVRVRKYFESAEKFEFQDGSTKTLKEHFEPLMFDPESPIGLGEVLKGIGYFVDPEGNPKQHAPPERNSDLHYFQSGWESFAKHCARFTKLTITERTHALEVVSGGVRAWPDDVLETMAETAKAELRRRQKNK